MVRHRRGRFVCSAERASHRHNELALGRVSASDAPMQLCSDTRGAACVGGVLQVTGELLSARSFMYMDDICACMKRCPVAIRS